MGLKKNTFRIARYNITITFLIFSSVVETKMNQNCKKYFWDVNVSGYVCNHGSPSGERDTASPRGRYGERLQHDSCLKIHM